MTPQLARYCHRIEIANRARGIPADPDGWLKWYLDTIGLKLPNR